MNAAKYPDQPTATVAAPKRYSSRDQIPADDPGDELTERCVPVGIRAAGDGNHRRELGVAESGEQTAESRQNEGVHDRRSGIVRRGRASQHEDAGPDDRPDAERRQIECAKRPPKGVNALFGAGFRLQDGNALLGPDTHAILRKPVGVGQANERTAAPTLKASTLL
jgi:hypothetical protein